MLQTPTSSIGRDVVSAVQKKKGIKSSLGRFFSKKDKVKGVKDTLPDGSASMMSIGNLSMAMSEVDSNYDTMSLSGGKIPGIPGMGSSKIVDYGRQKKLVLKKIKREKHYELLFQRTRLQK